MDNECISNWLKSIKEKYIHVGDEGLDDTRRLAIDTAIKRLKENEPRVLSFDEAHGEIDPILLEIKDCDGLWWVDLAVIVDSTGNFEESIIRNLYDDSGKFYGRVSKEYGKTWRCWNKRPTDEQRKAAKWE